MNTKPFLDVLTKNFPAKIICLVIAVILYVFYQATLFETRIFPVRLDVQTPEGMSLRAGTQAPKQIQVTVRGKTSQISSITEENFKAHIDTSSHANAGKYDFPIYVESDDRVTLMTPVEIHPYPEHISLEIEDEIVRYIPVSANISGEPAHGYEKRNVSVIPDRMEVIGPRSIIEDINALLTEKIDITDISDNFSSDVAISTINEYLHFKNDTIVSIKVNVAPVETTASFKGIPVIFENLPPDVNMKDVTYNVDVGVRGAMLVLEKLKASSFIASADCSSAVVPGEKFDVPVIIFAPENVRVVSQSRKTVNIEILQEGAVQTGDLIWEPYED